MKTRIPRQSWNCLFGLILLFSCGGNEKLLPKSTGNEGELVIVIPNNHWKNSVVGDTVKRYFQQEFKGLPQVEPWFKVIRVDPGNFNQVFRTNKNIFIVNIDPGLIPTAPILERGNDTWAKDQVVVRLNANDQQTFLSSFLEKREQITQIFHELDIERLQRKQNAARSAEACEKVKELMNVEMIIPEGYYLNLYDSNFVYFIHESIKTVNGLDHQITRGIWIYSFAFTDPATFTLTFLQKMRDSVTSAYIEGSKDSSHMVIEMLIPPDSSSIALNGEFAFEMRGLWKMQNYFKGGPFITYVTYDKGRNRILMMDGFVFAPNLDKRDYMLQLEAILRSAKLH
jgi:hypothetical protein